MMRGLGRAAFFLAIAVVTLLFIHIYRQNLIPVIEFKERTLDAGIVHDSNRRFWNGRFIFRNTGMRSLRIQKVRACCGSSVLDFTRSDVAPGGSGFIDVRLNLSAVGQSASQIVVQSNSVSSPDILTVRGYFNPHRFVNASPQVLDFGEIHSDAVPPQRLSVNVFSDKSEPISLKSAIAQNNLVSAKLVKVDSPTYRSNVGYFRTSLQLDITLTKKKQGSFTDQIRFLFSPPDIPPFEVSIKGEMKTKWVASPNTVLLVFPPDVKTEWPSRTVVFSNANNEQFSCKDITNPFADWLEVRLLPKENSISLVFVAKRRPADSRIDGVVKLRLIAAGREEVFGIPISARAL